MDFSKYVAMVSRRALYFARADKLGDPFEGSTTYLTRGMRDAQLAEYYPPDVIAKLSVGSSEFREWVRQWVFVNCWHMNECESAAMWRLYARTSDAVAVQSTYARLAGCLPDHVHIGEVSYVDYDRSVIPETNLLFALMHKRRSFEHERELRAVWMDLPREESAILARVPNPENGRYVPIDLGQLVERFLVAPTAASWFRDAVQSVTERYGCAFSVSQSALDAEPLF